MHGKALEEKLKSNFDALYYNKNSKCHIQTNLSLSYKFVLVQCSTWQALTDLARGERDDRFLYELAFSDITGVAFKSAYLTNCAVLSKL